MVRKFKNSLVIPVIAGVSALTLVACGSEGATNGSGAEAPNSAESGEGSGGSESTGDTIRIGVLATLTGAFATMGEDAVDGVNIALDEFGGEIGGKTIELFIESTDTTAQSAIDKARALIERDKVDIIVGPLSGAEGQAIKDAASEWPDVTFVVAGSAAENVTMRGVEPNVWRTSYSGQQPTFALGQYAVDAGYKKVAVVAEDYDFPYAQVGGFMLTYCSEANDTEVAEKLWTPIGTSDFSSTISQIPDDADALFVALGGTDMVNFINQLSEYGKLGDIPILGGTVAVDATQLASVGEKLDGVISGSIMSGNVDTPEFRELDEKFTELRERPPSLFVENYYRGMKWTLLALDEVSGDVSDVDAFRSTLQDVSFTAPASDVKFDDFHNVVTDTYINKVENVEGEWRNVVVETFPEVSQFWTYDPEQFQEQAPFSSDYPQSCSLVRDSLN